MSQFGHVAAYLSSPYWCVCIQCTVQSGTALIGVCVYSVQCRVGLLLMVCVYTVYSAE